MRSFARSVSALTADRGAHKLQPRLACGMLPRMRARWVTVEDGFSAFVRAEGRA
jgi:hypothetical protein